MSIATEASEPDASHVRLIGVPVEQIPQVWPRVERLVSRGLTRADGRYRAEDVLRALLGRDMQLWLAAGDRIEAICITEIVRYPRQQRCNLFLCAGAGRRRWIRLLDTIERWARTQGCVAIELQARPGWLRVLHGYRQTHVLLRKEL